MNVPEPKLLDDTVTVEAAPLQGDVADALKLDALGLDATVNDAVLAEVIALLQPSAVAIPVIVTVVLPTLPKELEGIENVPVLPLIISVAVLPVALLLPPKLYVATKVPEPILVEFTVTVDAAPAHIDVADGEVKLVTFGFTLTVNVAGEHVETVLLQASLLVIDVRVALVDPVAVNAVAGIVNVPVVPLITNVAVLPVELLAPLKLYVAVKVPLPRVEEFTVTVDVPPTHGDVADGVEIVVTFGFALTLNAALLPDDKVVTQPALLTETIVYVVLPELANGVAGITNDAVVPLFTSDAVRPVLLFAPLRLYIIG